MKTLIIYNSLEDDLKYFIVEGDYSKFHGVIFNTSGDSKRQKSCAEWLFKENGDFVYDMSEDKSLIENKEWDKVAIITWIP